MSLFLFDLDNTLIDTGRIVNEGFKPALLEHLDLDLETFEGLNQVYWQQLNDSTDFDPRGYTQFLADQCSKNPQELLEIVYQPRWYQEFVFAEVRQTLTALQNENRLGIFSQGNEEYQLTKLQLSGLDSFFQPENIHIFKRKLTPDVLASLPEATIIDDRIAVVETARDFSQITPIWLNRHGENTNLKIRQIQSLSELLK